MHSIRIFLLFTLFTSTGCAHDLKGRWTTDCNPYGRHASISNIHFEDSVFHSTGFLYERKGCAIATVEAQMQGSFKTGKNNEFDYIPTVLTLSLLKPDVVSHYNKNNICDYSDWELNVPKNIMGKMNCVGVHPPEKGKEIFDLYNYHAEEGLKFAIFPVGKSVTEPKDRPKTVPNSAVGFWSISEKPFNRVKRDLSIYDDYINKKRAAFSKIPANINDKGWVKSNLSFMVEIDQYMRRYFNTPHTMGYSESETDHFRKQFSHRFSDMDKKNTDELKKLLEIYDWFSISEFGKEADNNAWLLVQHADLDHGFQKEVLQILGKLWKSGETNSRNYAYLFDRVAASFNAPEKRVPQRYGTQGTCVGSGKWEPLEMEDPKSVDERRNEVGLEPLTDYIDKFKDICK